MLQKDAPQNRALHECVDGLDGIVETIAAAKQDASGVEESLAQCSGVQGDVE